MAISAVLLDLTVSCLEDQNSFPCKYGYILAPSLHKIGSSGGKYSWMTFIFGKGLP